jgi:hypothetical protein
VSENSADFDVVFWMLPIPVREGVGAERLLLFAAIKVVHNCNPLRRNCGYRANCYPARNGEKQRPALRTGNPSFVYFG